MARPGAAVVTDKDDGFVLLAVLVIVAIAALAGAVASSLARDALATVASDRDAVSAAASARAGLSAACEAIRWSAQPLARPTVFRGTLSDRQGYEVTVEPEVTPAGSGGRWFRVTVDGTGGDARHSIWARIWLRPAPFAGTCVCADGFSAEAGVSLSGSGLCAGGDVSGREQVTLLPGGDRAFAELWPIAGVHTRGSVFAAGVEVHDGGFAAPYDTDCHQGVVPPLAVTEGPPVADLGTMRARSVSPGAALVGNVLWLDRLPLQSPAASNALVVVVPEPREGGVICLAGERPDSACAVTLVIEGPARVGGQGAEGAGLRGGLLVFGTLEVACPLRVEGCVWAEATAVRAPFSVTLLPTWPDEVPAGFSECCMLGLD
jgi:hypothetical protein